MEWLIIGLFVSAVSYFLNQGERATAKQDALDLQHDAQKFESDETDEARQFQEDFYLKYQSPEALMSQYRNLGASESASLMSALGVSPSMPSPVKASSSSAGGLGAGVNTMSDLLNSLTGGFNQYMQGQKANVETEWSPRLFQANIDSTLGHLKLDWEKFGLEKDSYFNISKPLAEMALDKSRQEIIESQQRVKESDARIEQIGQQIEESKQNINESNARIDLINAQTETEGFKQENLAADTALKGAQQGLVESQTIGQNIQNALDSITLEMSQATGLDVRLNYQNLLAHKGDVVFSKLLDVIVGKGDNSFKCSWSDFSKAVDKTYDGLLTNLRYRYLANKAFDSAQDYMAHYRNDSSYKEWFRTRAKSRFSIAKDWVNKNTRYGM